MLPNFLVIGANKAGTTSLHHYLEEHPQVFVSSVKEPSYFAAAGASLDRTHPDAVFTQGMVTTREAYEALFDAVDGEKAVGEASTKYLASAKAPRRIREAIPDARLIAILRDPADRAHSAHAMYTSMGLEQLTSFEAAIDEEQRGSSWRKYLRLGFYSEGLAFYYALFPTEQIRVFLYEELQREPTRVIHDIFEHLDVDPDFVPDLSRRYNVSTFTRSRTLTAVLDRRSTAKSALRWVLPADARGWVKRRARTWNQTRAPQMSPTTRQRLIDMYEQDIRRVEQLIDRDLSAWRSV